MPFSNFATAEYPFKFTEFNITPFCKVSVMFKLLVVSSPYVSTFIPYETF